MYKCISYILYITYVYMCTHTNTLIHTLFSVDFSQELKATIRDCNY